MTIPGDGPYRLAARALYTEPGMEVRDDAAVEVNLDAGGALVQAWVWVPEHLAQQAADETLELLRRMQEQGQ